MTYEALGLEEAMGWGRGILKRDPTEPEASQHLSATRPEKLFPMNWAILPC